MGANYSVESEKSDNEKVTEIEFSSFQKPTVGHYMDKDVLKGTIATYQKEFFDILSRGNAELLCKLLLFFYSYPRDYKYDIILDFSITGKYERNDTLPSKEKIGFIFIPISPLEEGKANHEELKFITIKREGKVILKSSKPRPYFQTPGLFNTSALLGYEGYELNDIRWEWLNFWKDLGSVVSELMSDDENNVLFKIESFKSEGGSKLRAVIIYQTDFILDFS